MKINSLVTGVKISRYVLFFVVLGVVFAYFMNFSLPLSQKTDSWGQFGDYFGGLLNPFIGAFAFYWLTQSVLIQKEELSDAKTALKESADIQLKQAKNSVNAAKINALSTLLSSKDSDVSNLRNNIEFVYSQYSRGHNAQVVLMNGNVVGINEAFLYAKDLTSDLSKLLNEREKIRDQIKLLLTEELS